MFLHDFFVGLLLSMAVLWILTDGQDQNLDFSLSSTKFSVELFRGTLSTEHKNTVISSLSTSTLLAMLQQGASNSTKDEITRLLSGGQDTTRNNYQNYLNDIKTNIGTLTLEIASRDFANFGFDGSRVYEHILNDYFNSETRHTDFTQVDIASQMVNTFTSNHTGGKIENFVTPGTLETIDHIVGGSVVHLQFVHHMGGLLYTDVSKGVPLSFPPLYCTVDSWGLQEFLYCSDTCPDLFKSNAEFIILNTVNLNNDWKFTFRPDRIKKRDFFIAPEILVQVPIMRIQKEFKTGYIPHVYSRWLQLPLQNDRFYMILILPDDVTGLDTVVEDLSIHDISDIMNQMDTDASQLTDVYLPQLNIKEDVSMTDTLSRLQLESLFNNDASLCGISMNAAYVADVRQRAELVIDGNGVKLAAASVAIESKKDINIACPVAERFNLLQSTRAFARVAVIPELTLFNANHPFLAFVIDGNSKLPLFSARVLNPSQS